MSNPTYIRAAVFAVGAIVGGVIVSLIAYEPAPRPVDSAALEAVLSAPETTTTAPETVADMPATADVPWVPSTVVTESCTVLVPSVDDGGSVPAGSDYSGGVWTNPDGSVLGYSAAEDSEIWNLGWCAGGAGAGPSEGAADEAAACEDLAEMEADVVTEGACD